MRSLIHDLIDQVGAGLDVNRQVLVGVLLVGMLFASVHLVTMLVTRWGDHKATTKALLFSIIAHLTCASGLAMVTLNGPIPAKTKPQPAKPRDPFKFVEVRFDGTETFETTASGNTPKFDELPMPKQAALTRREVLPFDLLPLVKTQRQKTPVTRPDVDEPKMPSDPQRPVAIPTPVTGGRRAPMRTASIPQRVFDETARRRDEVQNPSPLNERVQILRPAETDDAVVREFNRGSADRTAMMDKQHANLSFDDVPRKAASLFKPGRPAPLLRSRRAPTRPIVVSDDTGLAGRRKTKGTDGANPDRIARVRTRPVGGVPEGGVTRLRPNVVPSQPGRQRPRLAMRRTPPLNDVRSGLRPNVLRPNAPARIRRSKNLPATYRLRSLANRKAAAEEFGGTDASELAVERALKWLAAVQHPDGYWDADRHGAGKVGVDDKGVNRKFAGKNADTGITALALLSFLAAGYTHEEGPHAKTVDKAIRWLIAQQQTDGSLAGNASHYAKMYCHGMATYALAEAYSMQSDPTIDTRLREPLQRAVAFILDQQSKTDGGWRYLKGQKSDMSMFGWQLMALKSAEIAGVRVPDDSKRLMVRFLKDHSFGRDKGLAAYQKQYPVSATMTAEALFCKQIFRIPREHASSKEAVAYLMERLPRRSQLNLYYWYYGTLAMFQYGGPEWKKWNDAVRAALVAEQITTGNDAGSWAPRGPWGPYGGRVFSTAVSALCLEVYYRFLPLYKMSGRGK
ncbi:MAG: prenyltransferase/squalene oxidase repeat-containing protein [Planctomycetaceae bacterium]